MDIKPTPIRDAAASFSGYTGGGGLVTGTIWFKVQGPIGKDTIQQLAQDVCDKAAARGAKITPDELMLVNVFISEKE